ncbi:MAG: S28 family serine protease [Prolixibacteraceae bacterium]
MNKLAKNKLICFLFFVFAIHWGLKAEQSEFQRQLETLPEVVSVQKIDHHPFFKETFEVMIDQYLDHGNPQAGKFLQRLIVSDYNSYSPVIFVTEGYVADYAIKSSYINELSGIIEANQLVVEHRYFGKSVPDDKNWDYLTMANAAADLHRIHRIFERIFNKNNKWVATGISKGGSNTMAYHAYYPDDMDIWIPYVGPINQAIEDTRMGKFIEKEVSSQTCRQKVLDFQINVLKNRDLIQPLLDSLLQAKEYSFFIPNDQVLDYCALEFSFAFWQWGNSCKEIPTDTASTRDLFNYLVKIIDPSYFSKEKLVSIKPFFIQTLKEFGYYAYNIKPLQDYLHITTTKEYIENVFLKDEPKFDYNKKTAKFISKAVQKNGDHMLLIYGQYDPWIAGAVIPKKSSKAILEVKEKGSHRARINNMSYAQQSEIYMLLETWLEED